MVDQLVSTTLTATHDLQKTGNSRSHSTRVAPTATMDCSDEDRSGMGGPGELSAGLSEPRFTYSPFPPFHSSSHHPSSSQRSLNQSNTEDHSDSRSRTVSPIPAQPTMVMTTVTLPSKQVPAPRPQNQRTLIRTPSTSRIPPSKTLRYKALWTNLPICCSGSEKTRPSSQAGYHKETFDSRSDAAVDRNVAPDTQVAGANDCGG